jgi:hypothetical protein
LNKRWLQALPNPFCELYWHTLRVRQKCGGWIFSIISMHKN